MSGSQDTATVDAPAFVTQAEYGRMRGWTRQRVHHFREDGRLVLNADGLVDVAASDEKLAATLDRSKAHRERQARMALVPQAKPEAPELALAEPDMPPPAAAQERPARQAPSKDAASAEVEDYWTHKARREKIEADRADLAYRKTIGELVNADEVRRSRRATAMKIASALQLLPAKLAPVVAPQDPLRAQQAMAEEIERVLLELAADLEAAA